MHASIRIKIDHLSYGVFNRQLWKVTLYSCGECIIYEKYSLLDDFENCLSSSVYVKIVEGPKLFRYMFEFNLWK